MNAVSPAAAVATAASVARWASAIAGVAVAGTVHPALAAPQPTSPLAPANVLQVTIGLAVVLVTILVAAWFLRRTFRTHAGAQGHIKVISGLAMGPREKLVLVQVGERQLLLGVSPGRIQALHLLDDALPAAAEIGAPSTFAAHLARTLTRGRAAARRERP